MVTYQFKFASCDVFVAGTGLHFVSHSLTNTATQTPMPVKSLTQPVLKAIKGSRPLLSSTVDDTASDNSSSTEIFMIETHPQIRRKKKKRSSKPFWGTTFADIYKLTGETLGEGSYGRVETCKNFRSL